MRNLRLSQIPFEGEDIVRCSDGHHSCVEVVIPFCDLAACVEYFHKTVLRIHREIVLCKIFEYFCIMHEVSLSILIVLIIYRLGTLIL